MASASKSIPSVFSAQPVIIAIPAAPVTQGELTMLLSLRGRLHQLAAQVESAEQSIRMRLEHGAPIEEGDHTAELKEHFRASVAWKEKAIELAERLGLNGLAWAQQVLSHTGKTRSVSLIVE